MRGVAALRILFQVRKQCRSFNLGNAFQGGAGCTGIGSVFHARLFGRIQFQQAQPFEAVAEMANVRRPVELDCIGEVPRLQSMDGRAQPPYRTHQQGQQHADAQDGGSQQRRAFEQKLPLQGCGLAAQLLKPAVNAVLKFAGQGVRCLAQAKEGLLDR